MADQLELQRTLLSLLAQSNTDCRLGRGIHYLSDELRSRFPGENVPSPRDIFQAFWSLVAQGLAYVDMSQPSPENWALRLSLSGTAAVRDEDYNPDDATGYLSRLANEIPDLSPVARMYVREAIRSYAAQNYVATTAMLGVASEAAMLGMAEHFAQYWADTDLKTALDNPRNSYSRKFSEVRKRLESKKSQLPAELTDGMSLMFDSVLDLLRINRNDAGHPTGKTFSRDDCFVALRMAIPYLKRISTLEQHFRGTT